MQKILTIAREKLPANWVKKESEIKLNISELREVLDKIYPDWIDRSIAELDSSYKQLIPYAVVRYKNMIACYKRSGDEKRLHDLYSVGIGGHVDIEDAKESIEETLLEALSRELSEEFADFSNENAKIAFSGIINNEDNEVGSVHLGMVFTITTTKKLLPGSELTGFEWVDPKVLSERTLENWSTMALSLGNQT